MKEKVLVGCLDNTSQQSILISGEEELVTELNTNDKIDGKRTSAGDCVGTVYA